MKKKIPSVPDNDSLRRQAADRLHKGRKKPMDIPASKEGMLRLIHELSVHQIELEMQKEELILAREELEEGLARYADLYDFAPLGYVTLSRQMEILESNLTGAELLGFERGRLIGQDFMQFVFHEHQHIIKEFIEELFRGELPQPCEVMLREVQQQSLTDGGRVPKKIVRISATLDSGVQRCRVALIDVSRERAVERENAELQSTLLQAQKIEIVGQLAGGIAHDFNNMLGVILGYTELALERTGVEESVRGDLEIIMQTASRSADLTAQLLSFARKQTITPKVLDLYAEIESLLPMLQMAVGETISIRQTSSSSSARVCIDPLQVSQILINLCINSRDAIVRDGTITLETGRVHVSIVNVKGGHPCPTPGEYITLTVTDTGSGISPKHLPHIFEPFFTTKGVGKGTGLGLSVIYGILKQNNGCIACTTKKGNGAVFTVFIPEYMPPEAKNLELDQQDQAIAFTGHTVLLVEDEPSVRTLIKGILESRKYRVLTAGDAAEALRIFDKESIRISILLTDVVMPDMNGVELSNTLLKVDSSLKTLFMSGYAPETIDQHEMFSIGENFIGKPFAIKDLIDSITRLLDS